MCRLLDPKCANRDCEITINSQTRAANQEVSYEVKIYQTRPEFCCSILPCRTKQNYAFQVPLELLDTRNCYEELQIYPQFNGRCRFIKH